MNRPHGWTDYQDRMARVVAYLHQHLDQPLDLARLAEVAHLSPFHWHRVYHALNGETVAATVRRLRLHRAAGELARTDGVARSVADIARRWGFDNPQSFSRAFRSQYGLTPAQYRHQGGHTAFAAAQGSVVPEGCTVTLQQLPLQAVAGLDHRGAYLGIAQAFEGAAVRLAALGQLQPHSQWLAQYLDDPMAVPEAQLASRAGLSVPQDWPVPAPLQRFEVGGGWHAVLLHRGPYASMRAAYQWLYGQWLVASGHLAADAPVFEQYLNHPRDTAPQDLQTLICLPLAALASQPDPPAARP